MPIHFIIGWMHLVVHVTSWWRIIITLTPKLHLLLPMDLRHLMFAFTLKCTIVSLIDPPRLVNVGGLVKVHGIEDTITGIISSGEH